MKPKYVYFFSLILLISACSSNASSPEHESQLPKPLDVLYGDKVVNSETKTIRPNNFDTLKFFKEQDFTQQSVLYSVESFGADFKIIRQKKSYSEARNFNIIVQIKNKRVSKYLVLNDALIVDKHRTNDGIYLLLGDEENHNAFWKTENKLQLLHLDKNLNEISKYTAKSTQFPLRAINLRYLNSNLVASVEVIAGCSICTARFDLTFDNNGDCSSAVEVGRSHSDIELNSDFIQTTFISAKKP